MLTHRSPGGSGWQRSAGRRDARAPHEGAEGGRVRAAGLPGPEKSFLIAPTPAIALQTLSFCPGSGLRPEGCTEPSAADSAPEGHKGTCWEERGQPFGAPSPGRGIRSPTGASGRRKPGLQPSCSGATSCRFTHKSEAWVPPLSPLPTSSCYRRNSYGEARTPSVAVFGGGPLGCVCVCVCVCVCSSCGGMGAVVGRAAGDVRLSPLQAHGEKAAVCRPGREASPKAHLADASVLDFQPPEP